MRLGVWFYRGLYPELIVRLGVGQLNFKRDRDSLFGERYGYRPSIVIGRLRITWIKYRPST